MADFHGMYSFPNSDLFAGALDIFGSPAGRGVMYYFNSGECDVGHFDGEKAKGPGVRFNRERDGCMELADGAVVGPIALDKALDLCGLREAPCKRSKLLVPKPAGYDEAKLQQVKAFYNHRVLAELPTHVSAYGANPYPPSWKEA
mmetsp:Transcript_12843/g.30110  ORF Transcript_12843/g.30110 Transcript_12843/m.30110 type:complete len:145 (-) Transcript_12843:107-541(-)